jgi:cytochrome c-type biogenesis protein
MTDAAAIGVLAAFAAGIVSFLSPCVLPLVPVYVSYVAGESYHRRRHLHAKEKLAALGMSAFFVAGFSAVFIALGAILAVSAAGTSASGVGLLAAYALGLGVPFLVAALFVDRAARLLGRLRGIGAALQIGGGLVLVALGVAMITGRLSALSIWLLDAVPALGRLG